MQPAGRHMDPVQHEHGSWLDGLHERCSKMAFIRITILLPLFVLTRFFIERPITPLENALGGEERGAGGFSLDVEASP